VRETNHDNQFISPMLERIRAGLSQLKRIVRLSLLLRGGSIVLVVLAAVVYVSFGLDRVFRLSNIGRGVTLLIYLGAIGWTAWKYVLRPLSLTLSETALADLLERQFPQLEDRLRSAVDFLKDPDVGNVWGEPEVDDDAALTIAMKRRVAEQAATEVETLEPAQVIDTPRVVSALTGGVSALALIGMLALILGSTFGIWFQRQFLFADVDYDYRTHLVVRGVDEDLSIGVPRGDPVEIVVEASKEIPNRVSIRLVYPSGVARYNMEQAESATPNASSEDGSEEDGSEEDKDEEDKDEEDKDEEDKDEEEEVAIFVHQHGAVTEDFEFTVEGGDYRSPPHKIRVLERPQVDQLAITATPPAYTAAAPTRSEGDVGELAVPAGSELEIVGQANKPLKKVVLETEGSAIELVIDAKDPSRFRGKWSPKTGGAATIVLEDVEQVPPDRFLQFSTHLVADKQPSVQVKTVGIGPLVTAVADIPFVINAKDDYRIDDISLAWSVEAPKGEPKTGSLTLPVTSLPSRTPIKDEKQVFSIDGLEIEPEKRLNIRIGATDNDALNGAKTGFSTIQSFLVVTAERLSDELIRREVEQRRVLEHIVEEERKVRDELYRLIDESWQKEGPIADADVKLMLALARTERSHGRALGSISSAVQQILAEMINNKLATEERVDRLRELVIVPLTDLAEKQLPEIATRIAKIREERDAQKRVLAGVELGALVDRKLENLEAVLEGMATLESFTKIVKTLKQVIKIQGESSEAVQKEYERVIDDVLGNDLFEDDTGDDDDDGDGDDGDDDDDNDDETSSGN